MSVFRHKKKLLVAVLTMMVLFVMVAPAFAIDIEPTANQDGIKETTKNIATKLVDVVQGVFAVVAVVFIIWAGIMFWGAHGDPNKISLAKKAVGGFIIAMICVFYADKIVGGLLGIFGM